MRRLRQAFPQVRWMLAGSIGLDTVASRLNIADSINDLRIETLGAFDAATSHELLRALAEAYSIQLSEAVREHIQKRVGWPIPFYLQLIFDKIRHRGQPKQSDVDQAFDTLLHPNNKLLFDFWRQRLRDELGRPDSNYAEALLNSACRKPEGVRRSTLKAALTRDIHNPDVRDEKLRYLLDVLENDGYLIEDENRWQFRSPLLREYWLHRVAPPESEDE